MVVAQGALVIGVCVIDVGEKVSECVAIVNSANSNDCKAKNQRALCATS